VELTISDGIGSIDPITSTVGIAARV